MLKELDKAHWLRLLDLAPTHIPKVLILRGTRNLEMQCEIARAFFSNVVEVGAPNGLIESVFIGELEGTKVGFACVYGAAMASEVVHIFGTLGTRAVIQTGNCGALADGLEAGDLIVPSEAFCGEGASRYYGGRDRVSASKDLRFSATLQEFAGVPLHDGPIYTTAALLAEGIAELEEWYRQGFIAVDMETATTFAVAEYFNMQRAAILYVFDNPRNQDHLLRIDIEKDARRQHMDSIARDLAFRLALELSC